MSIFNKIVKSYKSNLPFVAYRKPNSEIISSFFLRNNDLDFASELLESGFVFAPFDSEEKAILFPKNKADFYSESLELPEQFHFNSTYLEDSSSEKKHIDLVRNTISEINKSDLKKVVVSRKEEIELNNFDLLLIFKKLLTTYSNAFVYVWFHPKVGLWLGATPETLLQTTGASFKTMSLAGTQLYKEGEDIIWKSKELEEQQLVTDFIENQLQPIANNLMIDKTETIKAGNLLHLRTKVEGDLQKQSTLKELIRALHQTPAVCGLPREMAKSFIIKNENYNRSFYTGFLGELNLDNQNTSLFVNLRCMNIENNTASIYIGGGITKDSNPEKEWQETVSKSKTMKKVL